MWCLAFHCAIVYKLAKLDSWGSYLSDSLFEYMSPGLQLNKKEKRNVWRLLTSYIQYGVYVKRSSTFSMEYMSNVQAHSVWSICQTFKHIQYGVYVKRSSTFSMEYMSNVQAHSVWSMCQTFKHIQYGVYVKIMYITHIMRSLYFFEQSFSANLYVCLTASLNVNIYKFHIL